MYFCLSAYRYLSVKRKNCPYFSGIISRSLPHDLLETAEKVGIDLANKLKLAGADDILTKAKVCDRLLFKICFNCQDRLSAPTVFVGVSATTNTYAKWFVC